MTNYDQLNIEDLIKALDATEDELDISIICSHLKQRLDQEAIEEEF